MPGTPGDDFANDLTPFQSLLPEITGSYITLKKADVGRCGDYILF